MKLIDAVQRVLPRINCDDVNSIDDLPESMQVASLCLQVYFDMVSARLFPINKRLIQLQASTTNTHPTHMKLPERVGQIEDMAIRYNTKLISTGDEQYSPVKYLPPYEFLDLTNSRKSSDSNVAVVADELSVTSGPNLLILTDTAPTYFTSFDDTWLVFDSYNNTVDTTLQQSKTQAYAEVIPNLQMVDQTEIPLPLTAESLFINKVVVAATQLEEGVDRYALNEVRRQENALTTRGQRVKHKINIKPLYR